MIISYLCLIVAVILPVFLIAVVFRRFKILNIKAAKKSFNTLILKVDKTSRWRILDPAFFFARRLMTAMLLTLPVTNSFVFLQFVFILLTSHIYIVYIVAWKPFQHVSINAFVLSCEILYFSIIVSVFIFSDATPALNIKNGAAVTLIVGLFLLILANILLNLFFMIRGPINLKNAIL